MNKKIIWSFLIFSLTCSGVVQAFDLEDYATTYRANRDAYLKAANELKLATGPYKAARDARIAKEQAEAADSAALAEVLKKLSSVQSCSL